MKKVVVILCAVVGLMSCQSTDKKGSEATLVVDKNPKNMVAAPGHDESGNAVNDPGNTTTLQWLDSTYIELGTVKEGPAVEVSYRFKNTGDKNLVIENVSASCGCTIPEKPEEPIPPGAEGVIKARFNSEGRVGTNSKIITVIANTTPFKQHSLQFKVDVTSE